MTEYDALCQSGIQTEKGLIEFEVKCFSCNAPAQQFLKCINGTYRILLVKRRKIQGERCGDVMTFVKKKVEKK